MCSYCFWGRRVGVLDWWAGCVMGGWLLYVGWVGALMYTDICENLENCLLFTLCTQRLVEKHPVVSKMREWKKMLSVFQKSKQVIYLTGTGKTFAIHTENSFKLKQLVTLQHKVDDLVRQIILKIISEDPIPKIK